MKAKTNPRRQARQQAVQALYQWQLNPVSTAQLLRDHLAESDEKVDKDYCQTLIESVIREIEKIDGLLVEVGSRPLKQLNPVEHAVLRVSVYELMAEMSVPYKVAINEGVELAKSFGATDGYKYVNAVLNSLLPKLRPHELSK